MFNRDRPSKSQRPSTPTQPTHAQLLGAHRAFADLCIDHAYLLVPNAPVSRLDEMPSGFVVPVSGGPRPIDLIPLQLGPKESLLDAGPVGIETYRQADTHATLQVIRSMVRDAGLSVLAILYPFEIAQEVRPLPEGLNMAIIRASSMLTVVTPAAHESWFANTIWAPDLGEATTHMSPSPEDFWFTKAALTSFAEALVE